MDKLSTESNRTKEIMGENLSIEQLVSRVVSLERDLKSAKAKAEDGELFVAIEAVKLQKRTDPSYIDVNSDEFKEVLNARFSLFLVSNSLSHVWVLTIRTFSERQQRFRISTHWKFWRLPLMLQLETLPKRTKCSKQVWHSIRCFGSNSLFVLTWFFLARVACHQAWMESLSALIIYKEKKVSNTYVRCSLTPSERLSFLGRAEGNQKGASRKPDREDFGWATDCPVEEKLEEKPSVFLFCFHKCSVGRWFLVADARRLEEHRDRVKGINKKVVSLYSFINST